ncbi:hypothetical protein ACIP1T_11005 [Pseudomonas japonica]|uniref:Uncharacterized protein n=1 Tax=Pseudomonas japonica TaxID=256466 RepID=A0A239IMV9_9PSED|nr:MULTISPECIES: hypothetical protein [Pseudomonas]MDU9393110.1 hypothetical protein [Pseudomonas sp. zfem002]SNS94393.1 hypothetical protein SAMN05444352_11956 [Pseudomonas japonica]
MRIDGFSSQSYPLKRPQRKGPVRVEESDDDIVGEVEAQPAGNAGNAQRSTANLPARPQDMIFPRARDRRTAGALASYLTTAGFVDWEMEVLGLDLYI